tara:strand:+ start:349 stop:1200 length:852 start_codon:yes stop_codon:yes gene_type:complete
MTQSKKISTVIPTFNRKSFLEKAISSSLDQTINHEIIVCDHGSSDGTDEMIKKFGNKIKYVKKNKDHGPEFCWLDGVLESSGDFINLLHDDDWLEPSFIEKCMKYFDDPNVGFVFSAANVFGEEENRIINTLHNKFLKMDGVYDIVKYETYFLRYLISPTSLILRKKDIIDSIFIGSLPFAKYNYKGVGSDKLMILMCMLRYKKFGYTSEILSFYRAHQSSITYESNFDKEKQYAIRKAYEEVNNYYYILKYGKYFSYFHNRYFLYLKNKFHLLMNKFLNLLS